MQSIKLHKLERELIRALKEMGGSCYFEELASKIRKDEGTVAKVSSWLVSKGLAKVEKEVRTKVRLGEEGIEASLKGLPERRLVKLLQERGELPIEDVTRELGDLSHIAIMWAKKKGWINLTKRDGRPFLSLLVPSPKEGLDEKLIKLLSAKGNVSVDELDEGLKVALQQLAKRPKIVELTEERKHRVYLTSEGAKLEIPEISEEITRLTSELLVTGKWRDVKLSRFDVRSPTKPIFAGKRHPLRSFIRMVKQVFVELGFEEIRGPLVELAFWNYDALFVPQDHPARDMWDTFYLSKPSSGLVPKELIDPVKKVHEDGGNTGSTGWGYSWSVDEAARLLLRTHTTATTIRYLAEHREPPVKVFSVDRVYRNERTDWKHLAELHQIEGIVVGKDVGLRDLMGIVKEFCSMLGLKKVTFRPAYFPFTEPSAEALVYLDNLGQWLELVGMGIFRPEVTFPLGVKYNVLAWGGGLERLAMAIMGLDDIRTFYLNDLSWIRGEPVARNRVKA